MDRKKDHKMNDFEGKLAHISIKKYISKSRTRVSGQKPEILNRYTNQEILAQKFVFKYAHMKMRSQTPV